MPGSASRLKHVINGEMREKRTDMFCVEFFGMTLIVENNVALYPASVCFLCPPAEVPKPSHVADLIEQLSLRHGGA